MTMTVIDRSGRGVPSGRGRLAELARLELGFEETRLVRWLRRQWRRLGTPLGAMWFAFGIAVICGVLVHERCLVVAGGLGLVIGSGWYLPGVIVRNVRAKLDFEMERVIEGEEFGLNVRIEPVEAVPMLGLVIDTGSHFGERGGTPAGDGWSFGLPAFWPWRRGHLRRQVKRRANRFGIYGLERAAVRCSFPFGLREVRSRVATDGRLIVWPRIYAISQWPDVTMGSDDFGPMMSPAKGTSGDTTGLREFRRGDDPRRIHWPQTARLGHLVTREQQRSTNPRMSIHLEAPSRYEGWEADWAVRLAASFLAGAGRMGWQCDLDMGDDDSPERRRFHGRETGLYLDLLAGFGSGDVLELLDSDSAADEIPRDRMRLSIVPGRCMGGARGMAWLGESSAHCVIVLGECPGGIGSQVRPWLHFGTEAELVDWLAASGGES